MTITGQVTEAVKNLTDNSEILLKFHQRGQHCCRRRRRWHDRYRVKDGKRHASVDNIVDMMQQSRESSQKLLNDINKFTV